MEIVLVQQKTREPPEDAELLAQASLEGGGESPDSLVPATPLPPLFPDTEAQVTAPPAQQAPQPAPAATDTGTAVSNARREPILVAEAVDAENNKREAQARQPDTPLPAEKSEAQEAVKPAPERLPSATALLTNSFKIAALSAEIKRKLEAQSQRPRRKFVSASTREYKYAAYMEAWRAKVERVGNLNYPDEARRRRLSGSLILDVALNPDGTVDQITIRRSSGYRILDDAAVGIVNLAAPFAPFPDNIRSESDIMHITRTWQFLNNRGFR
ncbi:MAG: energy transducer TonB [bacterium]